MVATRGVGGVADHGAQFGHADFGPDGLDDPVAPVRQTRAQEHDAAVGFSRMQNDLTGALE